MQQLELFDYRRDYLFDNKNQIAHWYDILKETEDTISYAEHIDPNKGYAIAGMEYEEYVDVKKNNLNGVTYDQIIKYLKSTKKEDRLKKYLIIAEFNGVLSEVTIKSGTAVSLGQKIGKLHNPNILEFEATSSIKNTLLIEKNMKTIIKSEELNGKRMGYVSRINKTFCNLSCSEWY